VSGARFLVIVSLTNPTPSTKRPFMPCTLCADARFVCEEHPSQPFPHDDCPGPGILCPACQDPDEPPEMPDLEVLHRPVVANGVLLAHLIYSSAGVPDRPVALRIPEQCPHCGAHASVKPETTIKGEMVLLQWCCSACSREWPVIGHDEVRLQKP
jgi:hypothetical protein